jgi:hypothetical protein
MLRLSVKSPEELLDRNVVVIGYPAKDERNDCCASGPHIQQNIQRETAAARCD